MIAAVVALTLILSAAPEPTPSSAPRVELGAIALHVPTTWQRKIRAGTHRFESPKGDAYFVVDTGDVKTPGMEPSVCLGKITQALDSQGGGDWHKLVLGGFPAAHRSSVDVGKGGGVTVRTHTFVGCNGVNTWSILFHLDEKATQQYEPQVVAVAKSLEFVATEGAPPPAVQSEKLPLPEPRRPAR